MNQWLNPNHPPTLRAAVFLGYLAAVFGLLQGRPLEFLPLLLGVGVGAFATANNRRWGYVLLAATAAILALFAVIDVALSIFNRWPIELTLRLLNRSIFPAALAAAVLHVQSREYQKAWFE